MPADGIKRRSHAGDGISACPVSKSSSSQIYACYHHVRKSRKRLNGLLDVSNYPVDSSSTRDAFGLHISALRQRQIFHRAIMMSALPPKADMCGANTNVRFGPKADIPHACPV